MRHLFLFDVDSVLVEAIGYLIALQDAVKHFARRIGAGDHCPTDDEIRTFEAMGLGNEWDTSAICVAALLVDRLQREPTLALPADWQEALAFLSAHPSRMPHRDFLALAEQIVAAMGGKRRVGHAARAVLWQDVQAISGLHASRSASALLDTLLGDTYDFYRTPTTRYFQHLAIGSKGVAQAYGIEPDFESFAYLVRYDEPLLNLAMQDRLRAVVAAGRTRIAIYTARPSLPPAGIDGSALGYSPEGEIGRSLVGLEACPLIGKGHIQWLAKQVGEDAEQLVKPSPVQGLAAIGAASSGQEAPALEAAFALYQRGELRAPFSAMGPTAVHVFEDTVGGLVAVEGAVDLLCAAGVAVSFHPYGVVPPRGAKAAAMAARNLPTFSSVNDAIEAALNLVAVPFGRDG